MEPKLISLSNTVVRIFLDITKEFSDGNPKMDGDKFVIKYKIICISFLQDHYYHSSFKISFDDYSKLSDEITKLSEIRFLMSEDEWEAKHELPF